MDIYIDGPSPIVKSLYIDVQLHIAEETAYCFIHEKLNMVTTMNFKSMARSCKFLQFVINVAVY